MSGIRLLYSAPQNDERRSLRAVDAQAATPWSGQKPRLMRE
jgi:hypothetical protein